MSKEIQEVKTNKYILNTSPTDSSVYSLIQNTEQLISSLVLFSVPTVESRELMEKIRENLKNNICKKCIYLGKTSIINKSVPSLRKNKDLSHEHSRLILEECIKKSHSQTSACEGCRALKLKQIATGYIKGRRFKQI